MPKPPEVNNRFRGWFSSLFSARDNAARLEASYAELSDAKLARIAQDDGSSFPSEAIKVAARELERRFSKAAPKVTPEFVAWTLVDLLRTIENQEEFLRKYHAHLNELMRETVLRELLLLMSCAIDLTVNMMFNHPSTKNRIGAAFIDHLFERTKDFPELPEMMKERHAAYAAAVKKLFQQGRGESAAGSVGSEFSRFCGGPDAALMLIGESTFLETSKAAMAVITALKKQGIELG